MGRERKRENESYLYLIVGAITSFLTFALLLAAFGFVLGRNIIARNIVSYIIVSLAMGIIVSIYHYFRLFIAFWTFIIGMIVGYIDMYRVFLVNDFGWNDIVGLMSFFSYVVIGFFAGLILQVIHYFYKKYKASRVRPPDIK